MAPFPEELDLTGLKYPFALLMNAGCSGGDEGVLSLHNIVTTSDIVGRTTADSCTHNNPT